MFYKYLATNLNGKNVLYLYLNQQYEISNDLFLKKESKKTLIKNAEDYLKNLGVSYKGKEVYLVVDNIIVGKLKLNNFFTNKNYAEYNRFAKSGRVEFLDPDISPSVKLIDIENSNGVILKMKFNHYLFGCVAREMPFIANEECLKAQAIIARTFLMKSLKEDGKVSLINRYVLYFDKNYLKKLWKDKYFEYCSKIIDALLATDKEVLTFNGNFINCYTHYQNTGKTESSENILKLSYPYLKSVDSMDFLEDELLRYRKVDNVYLSKLLGMKIDKNVKVKILETTSGNNVRYIKFGDKIFDGLLLSRTLGLISNNFTVEVSDDYTTFLTKGCGLGLGLSKCGANVMAQSGYNYKEILEHYYTGCKIEKIS